LRRQSAFARRAGREGDEFQFWLGLGATIAGIGYLQHQELGPRDVVLVFTHDPKFDEPALSAALDTGAGYVGALGSRRTQERRVERLRDAGLDERAIARIHAPCGLDVGARTPSETAVSILPR
jgi:xanthine dehydrogenase accessory factor